MNVPFTSDNPARITRNIDGIGTDDKNMLSDRLARDDVRRRENPEDEVHAAVSIYENGWGAETGRSRQPT